MYLPKSKYTVRPAKTGEFLLNGEIYTGPVLTTYLGKTYAGSSPDKATKELVPISGDYVKKVATPGRRIPTEEEYKQGYMVRYFRQDNRTKKIDELLTKDQMNEDTRIFTYIETNWILTGSKENRVISLATGGTYTLRGVKEQNSLLMSLAEEKLPGIVSSKMLADPLEFYREKI